MDIVIALVGAKGAGKTTTFNVIKDLLPVQEITLADKLKNVSAEVFNIPRNHFDSHSFKEKDLESPVFLTLDSVLRLYARYDIKITDEEFDQFVRPHIGKVLHTPRQVAQYVGTEVLRTYEADIHCTSAAKNITAEVGVVTDMRFPNEFNYFEERYTKFHPIYIQNMAAENAASADTHASEAHLKTLARRCVVTLPNNSSIAEYQTSVRKYIKETFGV